MENGVNEKWTIIESGLMRLVFNYVQLKTRLWFSIFFKWTEPTWKDIKRECTWQHVIGEFITELLLNFHTLVGFNMINRLSWYQIMNKTFFHCFTLCSIIERRKKYFNFFTTKENGYLDHFTLVYLKHIFVKRQLNVVS